MHCSLSITQFPGSVNLRRGYYSMNARQYNQCYMAMAQKTFELSGLCLIEVLYKWSIDSNDNRNFLRVTL